MRRIFVLGMISTLFIVILLTPLPVNAHSPSSIELDYDYDSKVLTVVIRHSVSNPNSHYVYFIEIRKNDVSETTRNYDSQTNSTTQLDTFDIAAEDGDVLEVKGDCNQGGSITGQITITVPVTTTTTTGETTETESTTTTTSPSSSNGFDDLTLWILFSIFGIAVLVAAIICLKKR